MVRAPLLLSLPLRLSLREMASLAMRTSFSLLARERPRTCAVSAGEAKSLVMTALAIASSDNNGSSSIPRILMSNLAAGFGRNVFYRLSLMSHSSSSTYEQPLVLPQVMHR